MFILPFSLFVTDTESNMKRFTICIPYKAKYLVLLAFLSFYVGKQTVLYSSREVSNQVIRAKPELNQVPTSKNKPRRNLSKENTGFSSSLSCSMEPTLHDRRKNEANKVEYAEMLRFTQHESNNIMSKEDLFQTMHGAYFSLHHIYEFDIEQSAWSRTTMADGGKYSGWTLPEISQGPQVATVLEGDYVVCISIFPGIYGHFISHHLPVMAYLRKSFPATTNFLFVDDWEGHNQKRLEILDPEFAERVVWTHCAQSECEGQYYVTGSLTIIRPQVMFLFAKAPFFDLAREWIFNSYPVKPHEKTVIYYKRTVSGTNHARIMDLEQEQEILDLIEAYLENREEKLVIFDGEEDGATMSLEHQIELFRSATTYIGPHGTGLANTFWSLQADECDERPKILEFISGPTTTNVQWGKAGNSYYREQGGTPWLEYHHIFYLPESSQTGLLVDMDDVNDAFVAMWGAKDSISLK
mmetsp:Transcript_48965/g.72803  ORF Transcript_48965/g.72803 Transcript_48965/m.72803 type:complete len:468 (+) Transcript_48965:56-1459(+)